MSIERREYPATKRNPRKRTMWRVRWKEGTRHRSREVATYAEARAIEASTIASTQADTAPDEVGSAIGTASVGLQPQPQLLMLPDGRIVQLVDAGVIPASPVVAAAPVAEPEPPSLTLDEFWKEWIGNRARRCAPSTITAYESAWAAHVTPVLGAMPLTDIAAAPRLISDLLADMASFDVRKQRPRVGASTRRKVHQLLNAVLRSAVAWNRLDLNPMDRLDERAASGKRVRSIVVFSAQHVERMRRLLLERTDVRCGAMRCGLQLDARNLRDAALLTLLAYAGLRPAEALALRWRNVDLARCTVAVRSRNSDQIRREVKSDASLREVPLPPALVDDLRAWHDASSVDTQSQLVFGDELGRMWSKADWRRWADRTFKPAAGRVDRTGSRPYDLRHSFIMRLVMQGQPVPVVAALAGHTPEMTVKVYMGAFKQHAEVGIKSGENVDKHLTRARHAVARLTCATTSPEHDSSPPLAVVA